MIPDFSEIPWSVQKNWCSPEEALKLRGFLQQSRSEGRFQQAGIGRSRDLQTQIRGDQIFWVTPDLSAEIKAVWDRLENLRLDLNRQLFLGIDHFELHGAVYGPGQFYRAHVDQSPRASAVSGQRIISVILYLNPDWQDSDEGQLRMLDPEDPPRVLAEVKPELGTLVLFRSDLVLHEVLSPRHRERWSLTGWFRRR